VKLNAGDLVKFVWWSSYKAPSEGIDESGKQLWVEMFDGDRGIIIRFDRDGHPVVLFNRHEPLVTVYPDMLEVLEPA